MNVDPSVITNVKAIALTPYSVEVKWDKASDVTGYFITCHSIYDPIEFTVDDANTTSHTFNGLKPNTIYIIGVRASYSGDRVSTGSTRMEVKTPPDGKKYIIIVPEMSCYICVTPQLFIYHHHRLK